MCVVCQIMIFEFISEKRNILNGKDLADLRLCQNYLVLENFSDISNNVKNPNTERTKRKKKQLSFNL